MKNLLERIARKSRFEGWQATEGGKREVRKALRRTLAKYKLHKDEELFETCAEPVEARRMGM